MNKRVLSITAHPDDAEFLCTGTLALLRDKGWEVHIATTTAGDCGSMEMDNAETARVRKEEGARAAAILGGKYHCLDMDDAFVMYDKPSLLKVIALIREVDPEIVFASSPVDYSTDHEMTSKLAWNGCFAAAIPNVHTAGVGATKRIPYLYYLDVLFGKDNGGRQIETGFFIDVSSVISTKERMLCCHESQRNWLKAYHNYDKYIEIMKDHSRTRGGQIGTEYAETFRLHVGNAFPQDNILQTELGSYFRST